MRVSQSLLAAAAFLLLAGGFANAADVAPMPKDTKAEKAACTSCQVDSTGATKKCASCAEATKKDVKECTSCKHDTKGEVKKTEAPAAGK